MLDVRLFCWNCPAIIYSPKERRSTVTFYSRSSLLLLRTRFYGVIVDWEDGILKVVEVVQWIMDYP
jgi:hypothetical protein